MSTTSNKEQSGFSMPALPSGIGLFIDGLVIVSLAIVAGASFFFFPDFAERIWKYLGYGWAPVGLWAAAALFSLRYRPRTLPRYWRRWTVLAAAVALSLAALSYVYPARGLLENVSLAGSWGLAVGGPPLLPWGVAKMAGIVAFVPLALYPRSIGPFYSRGLAGAWRGLRLAVVYTAHGVAHLNERMVRGRQAMKEARERARAKRADAKSEPVPDKRREREEEGFAKITIADILGKDNVPPIGQEEEEEDLLAWLKAPPEGEANGAESGWKLPSIELLAPPEAVGTSADEFRDMGRQVEDALADQGVRVEVTDIKAGPRVVQFGLSPGWVAKRGKEGQEGGGERSRVKVQSIVTREKDLALALMTPYLRVEAPIPGTALGGHRGSGAHAHQGPPAGRHRDPGIPQAGGQEGTAHRHGAGHRRRPRGPRPGSPAPYAHRWLHRQRQERDD